MGEGFKIAFQANNAESKLQQEEGQKTKKCD